MNTIPAGVPSTVFISNCYPLIGTNGQRFFPFATNAPVTITDGVNTETVTPSSIGKPHPAGPGDLTASAYTCSFVATFTNAHLIGATLSSGTFGLQEAIDGANSAGGGIAVIDNSWQGQTGSITTTIKGFNGVTVEDTRSGDQLYSWNGTVYVPISSGGGGGNPGGTQGQLQANTSGVLGGIPGELLATAFPGADICQEVTNAIAALPSTGGIVHIPSGSFPPCVGSGGIGIAISKFSVTIIRWWVVQPTGGKYLRQYNVEFCGRCCRHRHHRRIGHHLGPQSTLSLNRSRDR
jgi:hypothetical protein